MEFREDISRGVFGAWRIARFDPAAMTYFNLTWEGFLRSFYAAALVLPFYLGLSTLQLVKGSYGDGLTGYYLIEVLAFAFSWVIYPLAMIPVAKFFDFGQRYVPYIIAWNWAMLLQNALLILMQVLMLLGVLPSGLSEILFVAALISVLYYSYLVARAALQCDWVTATGLVTLDFILTLGVNNLFNGLHQHLPSP